MITAAGATATAALTKAEEAECNEGRYVTVWLPREDGKPVPASTARGEGTTRLVNYASMVEKIKSGEAVVSVELLNYRCSVVVFVPGDATEIPCVLLAVLVVARACP